MHRNGFTLMEVLIAITITAVIGLGVWQVLNGIISSRDRVDELAEKFDGLQRTILLLERDLNQVVNRPARDIYGEFHPALTSREEGIALMLTRQGWRNPLGLRRSSLQRVAWEYTGTEVHRRYWPQVDQGQEDNSEDLLLLDDVLAFQVDFLDSRGKWHSEWPTDEEVAAILPGERPETGLPRALRITLEHEVFGEIERLFVLPDFDPDETRSVFSGSQPDGSDDADDQDDGDDGGAG